MTMFSAPWRTFSAICLPFASCVLLSGCTLGNILRGGVETHYTMQGLESDEATQDYLQKILTERIDDKTKTFAEEDDVDLRARQEQYLEQTIRADLLKALHAKGYYSANVTFAKGVEPLSGQYSVNYGPQYEISALTVSPDIYTQHLPPTTPTTGEILDAEKILVSQAELQKNIGKDRCFFNLAVNNRVKLNDKQHTGSVDFIVDAGREGRFSAIRYSGNNSVRDSYLRKIVPWKDGDCFRRDKIESYKTTLLQSGLFAQADIVLPEGGPEENGAVPVTINLKERAHRTISTGLTYYSDEGLGGVLGWEHRNLLGAAEKFKAELNVSKLKQSIGADFSKPYFLRDDQRLTFNTELRRQDTEAFEEYALDAGTAIERKFGKHLSGSTGLNASVLRINDHTLNTSETYGLLSAPQNLSYDTRNDTLDPKRGVNLSLLGEPFFDILGEADPFFKVQFTGSGYLSFGANDVFTIATKGSIGTIQGAEIDAIPATERFYAGGGGSVRGYGHQEVGPKRNGDPSGGASIATLSLELRTKFTEKFGGVAFVDAGSVSEESSPDFSKMAVGAGIGVRYYTSFGPLRFDIATPLTEKDDLEQNYQFYISIGQAF